MLSQNRSSILRWVPVVCFAITPWLASCTTDDAAGSSNDGESLDSTDELTTSSTASNPVPNAQPPSSNPQAVMPNPPAPAVSPTSPTPDALQTSPGAATDDSAAPIDETTAAEGTSPTRGDSTSNEETPATSEGATSSAAPESSAGVSSDVSDVADSTAPSSNICGEVVPEDHYIDGIPAYAQCEASESEGVWSNDGISTSAANQAEWHRTQWSGGYQCTEFAHRYLYFTFGVTSVPNGNAGSWCDEEPPDGLEQTLTPVHGDLIVFAPGDCGASAETGHVAVVDVVDEEQGRVEIVEQNQVSRRRTMISCGACFLHATANTTQ